MEPDLSRHYLHVPPAALVEGGAYQFGTYRGPIPRINPLDIVTGPPVIRGLRRAFRNIRMKEWQAFQIAHPDWFILGAVYNAKVTGLLRLVAVEKATQRILTWSTYTAPGVVRVPRGLDGTVAYGKSQGLDMQIENSVSSGAIFINIAAAENKKWPHMKLTGTGLCDPQTTTNLAICHPFDDTHMLYSNKAMMPFSGVFRCGDEQIIFDEDSSCMILDDHHGEYPSPQKYDWVTAVRNDAGATGGKNGVYGFNLTDNQIRDPDVYNENALWVGTDFYRLPAVTFDRPNGVHEPWHIHDADGTIDVTFSPEVQSSLHLGFNNFLAEYYAPFGRIEGTIVVDGTEFSVADMYGMGEQKFIRV